MRLARHRSRTPLSMDSYANNGISASGLLTARLTPTLRGFRFSRKGQRVQALPKRNPRVPRFLIPFESFPYLAMQHS